jgi:hypothetical protein
VVESTFNWYWLVDGLKGHGYEVHLAKRGTSLGISVNESINRYLFSLPMSSALSMV